MSASDYLENKLLDHSCGKASYTMPAGVTTKEIVYYSEGVPCYGKIFYPKGFGASKNSMTVLKSLATIPSSKFSWL